MDAAPQPAALLDAFGVPPDEPRVVELFSPGGCGEDEIAEQVVADFVARGGAVAHVVLLEPQLDLHRLARRIARQHGAPPDALRRVVVHEAFGDGQPSRALQMLARSLPALGTRALVVVAALTTGAARNHRSEPVFQLVGELAAHTPVVVVRIAYPTRQAQRRTQGTLAGWYEARENGGGILEERRVVRLVVGCIHGRDAIRQIVTRLEPHQTRNVRFEQDRVVVL